MKSDINKALRELLDSEDVSYGAADKNISLLRAYLAHEDVSFSHLDSEDELLAKFIRHQVP